MPNRSIIVIGASAGGVEALSRLVQNLPADLPAALLVVIHFPPNGISLLPIILGRAGSLPAHHARDGETVQPGCIYVAPPNYHMLLNREQIRLSPDPRENGHRPAIDPLFRSAARTYRQQVIGVILSGTLDDGTVGLAAIKRGGGIAIVQQPQDALFDGMPNSAIAHVAVDQILPVKAIATALADCTREQITQEKNIMPDQQTEAEIVRNDKAALERGERPGEPSMLTCPDCGGVLWELHNGDLLRYRCHVGHVYTAESLVAKQADAVETALWTAVRALEEKAALSRRMAVLARQQQRSLSERRFLEQAAAIEKQSKLLWQILYSREEQDSLSNQNYSSESKPGDNN